MKPTMSDSLTQTGILLQQIILPVIIIIGTIGNSLNIVVLTRRSLYHHACSRYFLALAINNLFNSAVRFTQRLLANGYGIDMSDTSVVACKIDSFIGTLCSFLSPYLIVLASMDRYCASSTNAQLRKFSNVRVAHGMVVVVITFFSLFFINILVMANLQGDRQSNCVTQASTLYYQVYIIIQVFLFAVVPPGLMMIFGLLTIKNTKHSRVAPLITSRFKRTENQLARMLFFQVGIHIFLTLPTSVTYLISVLPNSVRSTSNFAFVSVICQLFFYVSFIMPVFSYILSGRVYREQLIRLLRIAVGKRDVHQDEHPADQNTAPPVILPTRSQRTA